MWLRNAIWARSLPKGRLRVGALEPRLKDVLQQTVHVKISG